MPPAQQMQVQMVHRLAAVIAGVDDHAIAAIQLTAARNLSSRGEQMAQQRRMFGGSLRLRGDVLLGDDEQMRRGLGIDIRKADAEFVFVNAARRDLSFNDFAEQAVNRHR